VIPVETPQQDHAPAVDIAELLQQIFQRESDQISLEFFRRSEETRESITDELVKQLGDIELNVHLTNRSIGPTATITLRDTPPTRAFIEQCLKDESMKSRILAQSRDPQREIIVVGDMLAQPPLHHAICKHIQLHMPNAVPESLIENIELAVNTRWAIVRFKTTAIQRNMIAHRSFAYRGQRICALEAIDRGKIVHLVTEKLKRLSITATEAVTSWISENLKFKPTDVRIARSPKGYYSGYLAVLCPTEEATAALLKLEPLTIYDPRARENIRFYTRQPSVRKTTAEDDKDEH